MCHFQVFQEQSEQLANAQAQIKSLEVFDCSHVRTCTLYLRILIKSTVRVHSGNIAWSRANKHEAQPSTLFVRNYAPSAIFPVMREHEQ